MDLSTRHPVAGVRVRPKFLNGYGKGVLTDSRGRFTMPVSASGGIGGLFVDDQRFAGLFGKIVGREGHSFRQGEQDSGVIVPAIPAAELSGKVLDDDDQPIAGCEIELFRPRSLHGPFRLVAANLNDTHRTGRRVSIYGPGCGYLLSARQVQWSIANNALAGRARKTGRPRNRTYGPISSILMPVN